MTLLRTRNHSWKVRLLVLLLGSMLGASLGVTADFLTGEPDYSPPDSWHDWVALVVFYPLLSPIFVTLTGWHTPGLSPECTLLMSLGGLLFHPIYALLAWGWMKTEAAWLLLLIVLWCVQGFFMLLHRVDVIMSV